MKKKFFCILLIAMMIAMVIVGCGKKKDKVAGEEGETTETTETAGDDEKEDGAVKGDSSSTQKDDGERDVVSEDIWKDATELVKDNWEAGYISKVFISIEDGIQIGATYTDSESGEMDMVVPVTSIIDALSEKYPEEEERIRKIADTVVATTGTDIDSLLLSAKEISDYLGYQIIFQDETGICFTKAFQTKRLIVTGVSDTILAEDYNATKVITSDEMIVMQFETIEDTKAAYEKLVEKYGEDHVSQDTILSTDYEEYPETVDEYLGTYFPDVDPEKEFPWYKSWKESDYLSWGAIRLGADKFVANMSKDAKNKEIVVAVIDTGLNAINPIFKDRVIEGYSMFTDSSDVTDKVGHGTHVAGTILDLTRGTNVKVMPIQSLSEEGGSDLSVAFGIYQAIDAGADIINMSLGGPASNAQGIIDEAIREAVDAGITVVVAAGNSAMSTEYICPAHMDEVICVAATQLGDGYAEFSNYGYALDVAAPGVLIESASMDGKTVGMDGTSMACPHVAASAALLKATGLAEKPRDIEKMLGEYADDQGNPGKDTDYGYGIVNLATIAEVELTKTKEKEKKVAPEGHVDVRIFKVMTMEKKTYHLVALYTEDDVSKYKIEIDGIDYSDRLKKTKKKTKFVFVIDELSAGEHTMTIEYKGGYLIDETFVIE